MPGRVAKTLLTAAALVSSLAIAPEAGATPNGCWNSGRGYQYAYARCDGTGTGGAYQVYATCKQYIWPHYSAFVEGPWHPARSGRTSELRCPLSYRTENVGVGLRR